MGFRPVKPLITVETISVKSQYKFGVANPHIRTHLGGCDHIPVPHGGFQVCIFKVLHACCLQYALCTVTILKIYLTPRMVSFATHAVPTGFSTVVN